MNLIALMELVNKNHIIMDDVVQIRIFEDQLELTFEPPRTDVMLEFLDLHSGPFWFSGSLAGPDGSNIDITCHLLCKKELGIRIKGYPMETLTFQIVNRPV